MSREEFTGARVRRDDVSGFTIFENGTGHVLAIAHDSSYTAFHPPLRFNDGLAVRTTAPVVQVRYTSDEQPPAFFLWGMALIFFGMLLAARRLLRKSAGLATGGVVRPTAVLVGERGCRLVRTTATETAIHRRWKGTRVTCGSCGAPKWQSEPCEYCGG